MRSTSLVLAFVCGTLARAAWAQPAVFEIAPATSRAQHQLVQAKSQVLFSSHDGELAAFDLASSTWIARRPFPKGFVAQDAVLLRDDRVFVLGDRNERPHVLIGDGTNEWKSVAAPPPALDGRSVGLLDDGRVIVVGGFDDQKSRGSNKCAFFDVTSGRWSPGPNLPEPAWLGALFRRQDGSLYYVAHLPTPQQPRVFLLDKGGRAWIKRARAKSNQIVSGDVLLGDGRLVMVGGNGDSGGERPPTRTLAPNEAAFVDLPALPDERSNLLALEIKQGIVLAFGGIHGAEKAPPALWFLDMASSAWRAGPAFPPELMPKHAVLYGERLFVFAAKGTPLNPGDTNIVVTATIERLLSSVRR